MIYLSQYRRAAYRSDIWWSTDYNPPNAFSSLTMYIITDAEYVCVCDRFFLLHECLLFSNALNNTSHFSWKQKRGRGGGGECCFYATKKCTFSYQINTCATQDESIQSESPTLTSIQFDRLYCDREQPILASFRSPVL